ncbi:DNA primase helicase [Xanthomonas phage FoX7]|uniref:DNA primase helicase n=2 Tax=Carpasinavirus XcP1 TaxID=2182344 RepID=A0A858NQF6_9CAUD|nr:DNA primase helicase [Xanthomonas phage FoX6]QJB22234.1 DNA primase helicase [Xanthomonas phage FoX7]
MTEKEGKSQSGKNGKSASDAAAELGADGFGDLGFIDAGDDELLQKAREKADSTIASISGKRDALKEEQARIRREVPDIVARAKAFKLHAPVDFKEFTVKTAGGNQVVIPMSTDLNMLDAMYCIFGDEGPHFDTFRGCTIGWDGEPIGEDFDIKPLLEALVTLQLAAPPISKTEDILKRFARQRRRNSLIERFDLMIPEWDKKDRAEHYINRTFETFDTPLDREFSRYFWLSLYNRIMTPGCLAPMVMAMFGEQGSGKSYMGKLICEEVLGDPNADSMPLDMSGDKVAFLRDITGNSVIANVAEMVGFNKAEMTKVKDFTTRQVDGFDFKYEATIKQARQWIMMMDGNEYAGLQRDETGNRRFYPLFVAATGFDRDGKVIHKPKFMADLSTFRYEFWQIMSECRAWMEGHKMEGYIKFVTQLVRKVADFSAEEMKNNRGTVKDDDVAVYMPAALRLVATTFVSRDEEQSAKRGRPQLKFGVWITSADLLNALHEAAKGKGRFIPQHVKRRVESFGAESTILKGERGYLFTNVQGEVEWADFVEGVGAENDGWVTVGKGRPVEQSSGGKSKRSDAF